MGFVGWGGVAVALFGMFRCCGSCGEAPQLCCGLSQQACYRLTLFSQPLLVQAVLGEPARGQPCAVLCVPTLPLGTAASAVPDVVYVAVVVVSVLFGGG